MTKTLEQEQHEHQELQKRMVAVARRMMESKQQLQQEMREDMKNPQIRAAIDELKKRNAKQAG